MILKTTLAVCIVQVHVDRVVRQTVIHLVPTVVVTHAVILVVPVVMVVVVETIVVHHAKINVT